jgi:hypothetical protein
MESRGATGPVPIVHLPIDYKDIDVYLTHTLGLIRSQEDFNLYISTQANIILLFWLDDILLFSPSQAAIQEMKNHLKTKYKMSDLEPVQQFLGSKLFETDRQE